jgi:hypothetical protein
MRVSAAIALAVQLAARAAAAQPAGEATGVQPGHVRLVYVLGKGTHGCDDEAMFRRLLANELHRPDPFVLAGDATHELSLRFWREAPGFRVVIELRDAKGQVLLRREHFERTCADAVDRALIVVMIDVLAPAAPGKQAPADGRPKEETARAGGAESAAKKEPARADDRRIEELERRLSLLEKDSRDDHPDHQDRKGTRTMDIGFSLAAGALLTANLTPDVGPGLWLDGDARLGPVSAGVELRAVLPSRIRLADDYDYDYSQLVALATPCGRYWYVFGCAAIGGGVQVEQDSNFRGSVYGRRLFIYPIFQLGGRLGAEIPFGSSPVGARLWGEVVYGVPASHWQYIGTELKHIMPEVSAFFGAGLFVVFGDRAGT